MADDFSATTSMSGKVTVGGTTEGNIETTDDRDWFAVNLVAGRTYTIDLRGSPTDDGTLSDPRLYGIHDADGNLIANTTNDDWGGTYNSRVTFTATATGTFYIAAGAYGSNRGTYEVEVTDSSAADDTRAGANDFGDITALAGPRFLHRTVDGDDQVDYYRFTLTEAKRVGLGLRQQDANADLHLEDANGNVLYSSTNSGTGNEKIEQTLLAGTYYVRVESQAAGVNEHVVRYGVSAPDAVELAALQQQSGTAVNAAPAFGEQGYTFALAENADGSTDRVSLGTVAATDPEGTTPAYSLTGGNESGSFEVDATSGELFYTGSGEDFESGTTQFTLTVRASDGSETADTTVTVDVTDVNETPSFAETSYAFDLAENADGSTNRVSLGTVAATDPESTTLAYSLVGGNESGSFEIDGATGELFYKGSGEDFEFGTTRFTLTVRASDGSATTDTTVTVDVTDVNETPTFGQPEGYTFALAENTDGSTNRVSLGTVAATDPEGSTLAYSLVGDSGSFDIDATSGELFYAGAGEDFESDTTSFSLTVRASDGSETTNTTVTINVTDVEETVDPPAADEDQTALQTVSEPEDEDFSDDTSTSGRVTVDEAATGDIDTWGDRDWFAIDLVADHEYQIDLRGSPTRDGTLSDPRLYGIHDADGNLIAGTKNDDWGGTYNSRVTFTATETGTFYIAAGAYGSNRGTYEVEVTEKVPMIQVADAEATEGDDREIVFRVTLDGAASGPVTVSYTTVNGTAQAGKDYLEAYGTLTFAAGETEKTLRVTIIDDAVEDSGETFRLVLSDPAGAQLGDAEAVGTILNTERPDDYAADITTMGTVAVGSSQTGELESGGDVDWMKVTLVGGTRYVIDYEGVQSGRGTLWDPYFHGVYDANGNLISGTRNNNGGLEQRNSRIEFTPESSGTYFLGLGTVSPLLTGTYRVAVTEFDDHDFVFTYVFNDDYEDDTTTTGSVAVGGSATGNLQHFSDHDWFRVTFDEGSTYRIDIKGSWTDHGTLRDTRIAGIYDSNGNLIDGTGDDNSGIDAEARTIFTAPTDGTYYIAFARGWYPFPTQNSGTYTVEVTEVGDDDHAADTSTSGSVPVNGSG